MCKYNNASDEDKEEKKGKNKLCAAHFVADRHCVRSKQCAICGIMENDGCVCVKEAADELVARRRKEQRLDAQFCLRIFDADRLMRLFARTRSLEHTHQLFTHRR